MCHDEHFRWDVPGTVTFNFPNSPGAALTRIDRSRALARSSFIFYRDFLPLATQNLFAMYRKESLQSRNSSHGSDEEEHTPMKSKVNNWSQLFASVRKRMRWTKDEERNLLDGMIK
jgi:hypothetical protein